MKKSMIRKQDATNELIEKCAIYLNDNFHKFSQSNKIKIALEIFKRRMPEQVIHSEKPLTKEQREEKIADLRRLGLLK